MTETDTLLYKRCTYCQASKPLSDFLRRTGRQAGKGSRRGACRTCRQQRKNAGSIRTPAERLAKALPQSSPAAPIPISRVRPQLPVLPALPKGPDVSVLRPNRQGILRMRGKTDRGRRWHQETDLETAVTLVQEHAAVVINPHTVLRLYTNRAFRKYILARDRNVCYFCGEYGDTIDHLLPRAKGGHTTPVNCVCACSLCNQSKADRNLDEFMDSVTFTSDEQTLSP